MKLRWLLPILALTALATAAQAAAEDSLNVLRVRPNIYMVVGGGGNTTIQAGEQGVLIVNTKLRDSAESLLDTVKQLTAKPIGVVDTTHSHPALEGLTEEMIEAGCDDYDDSARPARPPPAATSPSIFPTRVRARRSSPMRTRCSG